MPFVMGLFQNPESAEQAVLELSLNGFTEKDVGMVLFSALLSDRPAKGGILGWLSRGGALGDTIDRTDGMSVMDGVGVGAVFVGLLGLVFGSRLRFGPITTGTGGMLVGGLLGYLIDRLIPEQRRGRFSMSRHEGLVMVQVTADGERMKLARGVMKRRQAKQIAEVDDIPLQVGQSK